MADNKADKFKPDERSAQEIAQAILTLEEKRYKESFHAHLQDAASAARDTPDLQLEGYGAADFGKRAKGLLRLLHQIAQGKAELDDMHDRETLMDCLNVTAGMRKWHSYTSREGLEACRNPGDTFEGALGHSADDIRGDMSDQYYRQKAIAKFIQTDIEPLFRTMAAKFWLPLDSPDIGH